MAHIQKRTYRSRRTGKKTTAYQARYVGPDGMERTRRFERKVDAERWLDTNGADIARGTWIDSQLGKVLFREYAKGWLVTKADVAERTRINVMGRIENHALPHFGNMQMSQIRPSDVRIFVAKLTREGLTPATVKAIYLTTSQVFTQAVLDGIIVKTPCLGITLPPDRHHEEMHFLTPEQVNDLAHAIDDRYRALIYTAAYGGLRAGELVALREDSLMLGELGGTIVVNRAASEVRGQLVFGPTKTGRKRVVGIPRFLSQMIAEHVEHYPSRDDFVFTASEGGAIRHRNFYRRHFRPAVQTAHDKAIADGRGDEAIPTDLRFHDLRHTCAAILIANSRHMEEVKEHLGHSSIRVTSDRYGHLFPSARKALAEGLEAVFQQASENVTDSATDKRRTKLEIVATSNEEKGAV